MCLLILVVSGNFDFVRVLAFPAKTYAVLIVDADAVLARPVAFEGFEAVAWWNAQMVERSGGFELGEFAKGGFMNGGRQLARAKATP